MDVGILDAAFSPVDDVHSCLDRSGRLSWTSQFESDPSNVHVWFVRLLFSTIDYGVLGGDVLRAFFMDDGPDELAIVTVRSVSIDIFMADIFYLSPVPCGQPLLLASE